MTLVQNSKLGGGEKDSRKSMSTVKCHRVKEVRAD